VYPIVWRLGGFEKMGKVLLLEQICVKMRTRDLGMVVPPIFKALQRLKQEDQDCGASLGFIVRPTFKRKKGAGGITQERQPSK
jgi:hypothetical protein